jgi:iron complex outermembrane receptor protein
LSSNLRLTAGARFEQWHAYDGYNANGATRVTQPDESAKNISPKAVLSWQPSSLWTVTGSIGQAYRYATASELYQLVSTGATFTAPNPNLKPDEDVSTELRVERATSSGRVQLALFQDEIHDAIISQYLPLVTGSSQLYSYLSNVDHVRARGVEAVLEQRDAGLIGLDFSGSVTYLDARTLALSGRASPTAPAGAAVGKRLPNIPDWRATVQAAYRFHHYWTISVAGRYSAKMFTTLDNADSNTNTYQGFSAWFVADVRAQARVNDHCTIGFGVDNVFNRKYFLFHPFPQRTFVADVKLAF